MAARDATVRASYAWSSIRVSSRALSVRSLVTSDSVVDMIILTGIRCVELISQRIPLFRRPGDLAKVGAGAGPRRSTVWRVALRRWWVLRFLLGVVGPATIAVGLASAVLAVAGVVLLRDRTP